MNLPPLPLVENCLFVDNSMLELLNTCGRRLNFNRLHRRIPVAESASLNFGSAIHLALELRYIQCGTEMVDSTYWQDCSTLLTRFFDQHPVPFEEYRNLNWAMEVVRRYTSKYSLEDFNLLEWQEKKMCLHCQDEVQPHNACLFCKGAGHIKRMVEIPFALKLCKLSGIDIFYCGRIDLPVQLPEGLFILDHKTTSMLGANFFDGMKRTAQQRGYCWSFQELCKTPVRGYIINAIRAKEPPLYVTKGTESKRTGKTLTPESWWEESLQRERFYLNPSELDEWKHNTISLLEEFLWNYNRGVLPMKTEWCVSKYGRCAYFDVCSLFPECEREAFLSSGLFKNNDWSPLVRVNKQTTNTNK
jgi:hypothetical protein